MPFGAVFEEHKEAGNGFFFCPLFYYRTEIIENSFYFTFLKTVMRKLQNSKTASEYESLYNFIDKARTAHK